jgi:hypothetical protein
MSGQGNHRIKTRIAAACILIFLLSVILRIGFVGEVLKQYDQLSPEAKKEYRYGFLTPDSPSYIEPANRIAHGDFLHAGSLSRPPGYPLFLWACGRSSARVLVAQAVLGALVPVFTLLLSFLIVRNITVSVVAGLFSSFSPTGTGVTGLVLADLLLAVLFVLGLLLLLVGASRDHKGWIASATLVFGFAGLVKPVILLWPVTSVAVWWFFRRAQGRFVKRTHILLLVVIPGLLYMCWALCNYAREKVFSVSDIGPRAVRVYWAVAVEEWGKAQREPTSQAIRANRTEIRGRLAQLPPHERQQIYRKESLEIFLRDPALTIIVFLSNMKEPAVQGWDYFHLQLPLNRSLLAKLQRMSIIESFVRKWIRWPVMLAFLVGILAVRFFPSPESRRLCNLIFGVSLAYFYFALMSGVTFWTGPRVVYPNEPVALTILGACAVLLWNSIRNVRTLKPPTKSPAA